MGSKRPTKAQLRQRYLLAGWIGGGVLAGLLAGGAALWLGGDGQQRAAEGPTPLRPAPLGPGRGPAGGSDGLLSRGPRAAIIIDDLGNSRRRARAVNRLPFPLAVAVLPGSPYAVQTARRAHGRGKEVLVHMPMEPGDPAIRLGPTFLRLGMGRQELTATLRSNLRGIPFVAGINNHMGSALTARSEPMAWVMAALRRRGLFFIDSRTTADSRGLEKAREAGVPAAARDVFLDHKPSKAAVRAQFRQLLAEARARGTAIGIGHPRPETLSVLREMLPEASARGVEIVPVTEVVAVRARHRAEGGALARHGMQQRGGEQP